MLCCGLTCSYGGGWASGISYIIIGACINLLLKSIKIVLWQAKCCGQIEIKSNSYGFLKGTSNLSTTVYGADALPISHLLWNWNISMLMRRVLWSRRLNISMLMRRVMGYTLVLYWMKRNKYRVQSLLSS